MTTMILGLVMEVAIMLEILGNTKKQENFVGNLLSEDDHSY